MYNIHIHTHTYIYTFFICFSIMVYHRILNVLPGSLCFSSHIIREPAAVTHSALCSAQISLCHLRILSLLFPQCCFLVLIKG